MVAAGARAARFYAQNRDKLFPGVPVLAIADERALPLTVLKPGDSVVTIKTSGTQMVNSILELLPDTTTIAVILGNSPTEQFWVSEFRKEFAPIEGRIKFLWFNDLSLPEMRDRVASLLPGTVVLYTLLQVDAAGIPYQGYFPLSELRAASNVPVFSFFESEMGQGVVGGALLPDVQFCIVAARVASRMLRGEATNGVTTTHVVSTEPRFDWRELQRWGIDESRLPRDSVVLFRPPSMWQEHKFVVLGALGFLFVQSGLIVALLAQRARSRRAESESLALSGRLLTAHEDERRRLARELHDDVTQRLARIAIDVARFEGTRIPVPPAQRAAVHEDLVRLSDDVHALSYRLHPSILDDLGLEEALKTECEQVSGQGSVRVDVEVQPLPTKLPQDIALCIFRIAQEALRNVVRHAQATVATVTLALEEGGLVLVVTDNGSGFEVEGIRARPSLGHASMDERIRLLGGRLVIKSKPGQGTTLSAWVPLTSTSS